MGEKKLLRGTRSGLESMQRKRGTRLVLTVGVVRIEDVSESSLFRRATLLDGLTFLD